MRDSYLRQAASNGWVVLDADRDRDTVAADVYAALRRASSRARLRPRAGHVDRARSSTSTMWLSTDGRRRPRGGQRAHLARAGLLQHLRTRVQRRAGRPHVIHQHHDAIREQ